MGSNSGAIMLLASLCLGFGVAYLRLSPFSFRDEIRGHAKRILEGLNGDLEDYKDREYCQWLLWLAGKTPKMDPKTRKLPFLVRAAVSGSDRVIAGSISFFALATVLVLTCIPAFTEGAVSWVLPTWASIVLWILFSLALSCIVALGAVGNRAVTKGRDQAATCGEEIAGFMKPRRELKPVETPSESKAGPSPQAAS